MFADHDTRAITAETNQVCNGYVFLLKRFDNHVVDTFTSCTLLCNVEVTGREDIGQTPQSTKKNPKLKLFS